MFLLDVAIIIAVVVAILFDIITGIIKAVYFGNINSTYLRKGLLHKATELLTISGAALMEAGLQYIELGIDIPLLKGVGCYIIIMELISIIENISEVNPALGKLLKPYLEKLKGDDKDG